MNDISNINEARGLKLYPAEYGLQLEQAKTISAVVAQFGAWISRKLFKSAGHRHA